MHLHRTPSRGQQRHTPNLPLWQPAHTQDPSQDTFESSALQPTLHGKGQHEHKPNKARSHGSSPLGQRYQQAKQFSQRWGSAPCHWLGELYVDAWTPLLDKPRPYQESIGTMYVLAGCIAMPCALLLSGLGHVIGAAYGFCKSPPTPASALAEQEQQWLKDYP